MLDADELQVGADHCPGRAIGRSQSRHGRRTQGRADDATFEAIARDPDPGDAAVRWDCSRIDRAIRIAGALGELRNVAVRGDQASRRDHSRHGAMRCCWPAEGAAAPERVEPRAVLALNSTTRLGLVTLTPRTETPASSMVRTLMRRLPRDSTATTDSLHWRHAGQARIRNASIKKSMSTRTFSETFLRVG